MVGTTKAVGDLFGKGGIADRMIWFNGFPFLDNKDEHTFGVPVSEAMTRDLLLFPAFGTTVKDIGNSPSILEALRISINIIAHYLENHLRQSSVQGFPIVDDLSTQVLRGYIGRTELRYALGSSFFFFFKWYLLSPGDLFIPSSERE